MEPSKGGAVAGEGKAVTSSRSSFGMSCGAPESVEAVTAKAAAGEQTGKAHGDSERDAQYGCMPVVSKAGNRVTWNHFLFWNGVRRVCSALSTHGPDYLHHQQSTATSTKQFCFLDFPYRALLSGRGLGGSTVFGDFTALCGNLA